MDDYESKIGIFSPDNILTERLKSKFQDKYLEVIVFDDFKKTDLSKLSYLVVNLLDSNADLFDKVKLALQGVEAKIVILYPLYIKEEEKYVADSNIKSLIEMNDNLGVILVPEILGKDMNYVSKYISHDLIMQSVVSERVKIANSALLINTVSLQSLVERVVKEVFSFGISGQALALIGPRRGLKSFLTKYLSVSEENIILTKNNINRAEVAHTISAKIDFSLRLAVRATRMAFESNLARVEIPTAQSVSAAEVVKKIPRKISSSKPVVARLIKVLAVFLALFALPMLILIISVGFLYFAVKTASTNSDLSLKLIKYSAKTVDMSRSVSFGIPIYYNYSNIVYKSVSLFEETLNLSKTGNEFVSNIMGDSIYDLAYYADNISSILDRIHTDVGFLQSDINELDDFVGLRLKDYMQASRLDIGNYKNKVYFARGFSSRLSTLLGMDKPMKYLVLFQNNMELRPTGGFIGSFALISVNKGRVTEIVVNDVYSADGQLKGHVDPPQPIKEHLGEGGWYLRDANWDPDFPASAEKIEWFLDKEINTKVDGVIAIDLYFVQSLLKITGPINLVDFNKTISSDNLYASTQSEVESDFFPGSIKKASFMTSLSRQLIAEIESLESDRYFSLLREIYSSLEGRHVQLYFHDLNAQESISNLGYSGEIDINTECGERCYEDQYSVIDANVGVNKANYFVNRSQDLNLTVSKESINHELLITYQNSANQALGNAGLYKSYTRLVLPTGSTISGVRAYDMYGNYEDLKYDSVDVTGRMEVGFLINILPKETKKIQVVWSNQTQKLLNGGEYRIFVRKQAGTVDDKLSISLNKSDLSLTGRAPSVYTTTLSRDFKALLFFKP